MFTIFWKSIVSIFLTILIVVNVSYAFNVQLFVTSVPRDMSTSYFGVSSIMNFLQTRSIDNAFLRNFKNFVDSFYNFCARSMTTQALQETNWNDPLGWLSFIGNLILFMITPILFLANFVLYFIYLLYVVLYFIGQVFVLFDYGYTNTLPTYTYDLPMITTPVV